MARRSARDISGWVVVDKPAGITSTAVVGKVRWAFGAAKAGHAGTLDPAATGVLAVALGEATKTIPYITDALKCYRFAVRFGAATTTDDAEGEVVATSPRRPADDEIRAALQAFTGDILQVPPQFSAVKVAGERAYDRARAGETLDLAPRPLHVEQLRLLGRPDADTAVLEMVCGKGGYVRSIARDLGRALGCLGHVLWLRREWSGPFAASAGHGLQTIERLARAPEIDRLLLPLETALRGLREVRATPEGAVRLRNGNAAPVTAPEASEGEEVWVSVAGRAVAVGRHVGGEVRPSRVFREATP